VGNATSCGSDLPPLKSGQQVFILGAGQTDDDDHVEVGFGELVNGFRESEATVHLRSVQPASGTAVGSGSNSGATLHVGDVVRVVRPTYSEGGKHRCGKHRCGTLGPVPLLLPPPSLCSWVQMPMGGGVETPNSACPATAMHTTKVASSHNTWCGERHLARGADPQHPLPPASSSPCCSRCSLRRSAARGRG
jgi:hypothetical protein